MTVTELNPGISAASRVLARQLREIADHIEADELETQPHGAILCLTGPFQHEVLPMGDPEGNRGARSACHAILLATFRTVGGNIRTRNHQNYQAKAVAELVQMMARKKGRADD